MKTEDIFQDTVDSIAFGGDGVMRYKNKVVFVPLTAPQDKAEVSITDLKSSYANGKLERIISPSPQRCEAKCQYFGECGGCHLQHIKYEHQTEQKLGFVKDSITRIAKITTMPTIDMISSVDKWAYRRHITLTAVYNNNNITLGFYKKNSKQVINIESCPIFSEDKHIFAKIKKLLSKLPPSKFSISLSLMKSSKKTYTLVIHWNGKIPYNASDVIDRFMADEPVITSIVLANDYKLQKHGITNCFLKIDGLNIEYSPLSFIQVNPEQSEKIYQDILSIAKNLNPERILDLYCGVGITSLILAKNGYKVTGVENNNFAVKHAVQNSKINNIKGAYFICSNVEDSVETLIPKNYDLVVINPPRNGIDKKTITTICKYKPKHIVYISCMPPTLARDIKELTENNYTLKSIKVYDMFPQTTHVETVCLLSIK